MKPELRVQIFERFPWANPEKCDANTTYSRYGLQIGDGWAFLLTELFEELETLYAKKDLGTPALAQVKQKFGLLRVYLVDCPLEAFPILEQFESKSEHICYDCGGAGSLRGLGKGQMKYWITLCDACELSRST